MDEYLKTNSGSKLVYETSQGKAWLYWIENQWHICRHNKSTEIGVEVEVFGDIEIALEKLKDWAWNDASSYISELRG